MWKTFTKQTQKKLCNRKHNHNCFGTNRLHFTTSDSQSSREFWCKNTPKQQLQQWIQQHKTFWGKKLPYNISKNSSWRQEFYTQQTRQRHTSIARINTQLQEQHPHGSLSYQMQLNLKHWQHSTIQWRHYKWGSAKKKLWGSQHQT